jgi:hypothetical protein
MLPACRTAGEGFARCAACACDPARAASSWRPARRPHGPRGRENGWEVAAGGAG